MRDGGAMGAVEDAIGALASDVTGQAAAAGASRGASEILGRALSGDPTAVGTGLSGQGVDPDPYVSDAFGDAAPEAGLDAGSKQALAYAINQSAEADGSDDLEDEPGIGGEGAELLTRVSPAAAIAARRKASEGRSARKDSMDEAHAAADGGADASVDGTGVDDPRVSYAKKAMGRLSSFSSVVQAAGERISRVKKAKSMDDKAAKLAARRQRKEAESRMAAEKEEKMRDAASLLSSIVNSWVEASWARTSAAAEPSSAGASPAEAGRKVDTVTVCEDGAVVSTRDLCVGDKLTARRGAEEPESSGGSGGISPEVSAAPVAVSSGR